MFLNWTVYPLSDILEARCTNLCTDGDQLAHLGGADRGQGQLGCGVMVVLVILPFGHGALIM